MQSSAQIPDQDLSTLIANNQGDLASRCLLALAEQNNSAAEICEALKQAKQQQLFSDATIQQLLCTAIKTYNDKITSLPDIFTACKKYSSSNTLVNIFKDHEITNTACENNLHASVYLLLTYFGRYILPSDAFNNYLLALAENEDNIGWLNEILDEPNTNEPLFYPNTIKSALIKILSWKNESKQKHTLQAVKQYTAFKNFSSHEIFFDDELFNHICSHNLFSFIKYFIINYYSDLTQSKALSNYLLSKMNSFDYHLVIEILSLTPDTKHGLHNPIFSADVLGKIFHTAISRKNDALFAAACHYYKRTDEAYKAFTVLNDEANPLIAACRLDRENYAIQLAELAGDLVEFGDQNPFHSNRTLSYDLALREAYECNWLGLTKKLLERSAPLNLFTADIANLDDPTYTPTNPKIMAVIKRAELEREIFGILSNLPLFSGSAHLSLSNIREAFKNGASIHCRQHFNGDTLLMFMGRLNTGLYTPGQRDFFFKLVDLFIELGADVKQLATPLVSYYDPKSNFIHYAFENNNVLFIAALKTSCQRHQIDTTDFDVTVKSIPPVILSTEMIDALDAFGRPEPAAKPLATTKSAESSSSKAPAKPLNIPEMIQNTFTVNNFVFDWDKVPSFMGVAELNQSAPAGTKKRLFFEVADEAGLLDVFIYCLNSNKTVPTVVKMKAFFQYGLKPTPLHSKSVLSANEKIFPYMSLLLDLRIPCFGADKFNIITSWLITSALSTDLTPNIIADLKQDKLEIWNAIKAMYASGKISLDDLKEIQKQLAPDFKELSAIRSIIWAGRTVDPSKKRLGTILTELDALIKSSTKSFTPH